MDNENNNQNKPIEVVTGDGSDLDISSVSTHIPISKPKIREKDDREIIIPKEKKLKKDEKSNNE